MPSSSGITMRLAATRFQCRSIASAGFGSCAFSTRSIAARAGVSARIVERALRKRRRKARGHQQHVAFAQRHLQPLGEPQHHVARRRGAAGLDEAEMPRRNLGVAGEIELAEMAALPPLPQVIADMDGLRRAVGEVEADGAFMAKIYHANFAPFHDLRGNRFAARCRVMLGITIEPTGEPT